MTRQRGMVTQQHKIGTKYLWGGVHKIDIQHTTIKGECYFKEIGQELFTWCMQYKDPHSKSKHPNQMANLMVAKSLTSRGHNLGFECENQANKGLFRRHFHGEVSRRDFKG